MHDRLQYILVKQAAAATESLEEQPQHLTVTVAHFKMDDASGVDSSFATEPAIKAQKTAHVPVGHLVKLEPQPAGSDGWEEF
jgi:methyl-accepting chemotaxis protein